jgi:hypothetical protein
VYGGADIGECLATAARIKGTALDGWYSAWTATATAIADMAGAELAAGRVETARSCFFRASNFRAGDGPGPRPTALLIGGYDGTAEELHFFNGVAALEQGFDVLAFDGPGQGSVLIQRGLVLRPDYETVVSTVIDHLLARPGADPDRIVVIGLSLGAHLGPRAVGMGAAPGPARPRRRRPARVHLRVARLHPGRSRREDHLPILGVQRGGRRHQRLGAPARGRVAVPDDVLDFTAAEGADDHCEAGARTPFHARAFGWLSRGADAEGLSGDQPRDRRRLLATTRRWTGAMDLPNIDRAAVGQAMASAAALSAKASAFSCPMREYSRRSRRLGGQPPSAIRHSR